MIFHQEAFLNHLIIFPSYLTQILVDGTLLTFRMPDSGMDFPVGAELCRWLARSGLLDGHLAHCTSELRPARPLNPDSSVNVADARLERIEWEFPFKSNFLWPLVLFYPC